MTTTNRPRVGGKAAIDEVSCSYCKPLLVSFPPVFGWAIFLRSAEEMLVLDF